MSDKKTVTTKHPDYLNMAAKWKRCRDVAAGRDAVIGAAELYLPRLAEQTDENYKDYLMRSSFFNATWRTICGMGGMLHRKPPTVDVPAAVKDYLDDVTMGGEPLMAFVRELSEECLTVGRAGVLVDHPPAPADQIVTVAMAQRLGMRPTLQRYPAESIINWRTGRVNNATKLILVVLTEEAPVYANEFAYSTETRYRVLDLVQNQADGAWVYRMRLFRINTTTDSQEQIGGDFYPLMNNKPLAEIPFVFFGVDSTTVEVDEPPLIDVVDVNLDHYRVSADYESGCHLTALPTAVVAGYMPLKPGEKLHIGTRQAWVFPEPSAHATFLEFTGAGLGALAANRTSKEEQMAALGARLLAADKRMTETATTAAIHQGGESSILSTIAQVISLGMTKCLTLFSQWGGATGDAKYELNRDFFPMPMDGPTLLALVSAWQSGGISKEVLFENLQAGEIIAPDRKFETEEAKIANSPPTSSGTLDTNLVA